LISLNSLNLRVLPTSALGPEETNRGRTTRKPTRGRQRGNQHGVDNEETNKGWAKRKPTREGQRRNQQGEDKEETNSRTNHFLGRFPWRSISPGLRRWA